MAVKRALLIVDGNSPREALALNGLLTCGIPCEVEVIRHGGAAISDLLSDGEERPQLIVLEISDPQADPIPLLREIRGNAKTRYTPVVIISPVQTEADLDWCLKEGADQCINTPAEPSAFIEHVSLIARSWLSTADRPAQNIPTTPADSAASGEGNSDV